MTLRFGCRFDHTLHTSGCHHTTNHGRLSYKLSLLTGLSRSLKPNLVLKNKPLLLTLHLFLAGRRPNLNLSLKGSFFFLMLGKLRLDLFE